MANRLLRCSKCGLIIGTYPKYCPVCGGEPMTTDENPHVVPVPKSSASKWSATSSTTIPKPKRSRTSSTSFYGSPFGSFNSTVKAPKSERERLIDLLSGGATAVVVSVAFVLFAANFLDKLTLPKLDTKGAMDFPVVADYHKVKPDTSEAIAEYKAKPCNYNDGVMSFGDNVSLKLPKTWTFSGWDDGQSTFLVIDIDGSNDFTSDNNKVIMEQQFGDSTMSAVTVDLGQGAILKHKNGSKAILRVFDNGRTADPQMVTARYYIFDYWKNAPDTYKLGNPEIIEKGLFVPKDMEVAECSIEYAPTSPPQEFSSKTVRVTVGGSVIAYIELDLATDSNKSADELLDSLMKGFDYEVPKKENTSSESSLSSQVLDNPSYQEVSLGKMTINVNLNIWNITENDDENTVSCVYNGINKPQIGSAFFRVTMTKYPEGEKHGDEYAKTKLDALVKECEKNGFSAFYGNDMTIAGHNAPNAVITGSDGTNERVLVIADGDCEYILHIGGNGEYILYTLGNEITALLDNIKISE